MLPRQFSNRNLKSVGFSRQQYWKILMWECNSQMIGCIMPLLYHLPKTLEAESTIERSSQN